MQNNSCNKGDNCDFRHDLDIDEQSRNVCKYFKLYGRNPSPRQVRQKEQLPLPPRTDHLQGLQQRLLSGRAAVQVHSRIQKAAVRRLLPRLLSERPGLQVPAVSSLSASIKMFYENDKVFFQRMNPDMKIVSCNKCREIGHKSNNCEKIGEKDSKDSIGAPMDFPTRFPIPPPPPPPAGPSMPRPV